ncbi:hypothetical protein KY334_02500, partial [Candidatus Woesearchaeota archaeon]|nr:hypothetical protein [Candidatus Woesearchaeota archaeon]
MTINILSCQLDFKQIDEIIMKTKITIEDLKNELLENIERKKQIRKDQLRKEFIDFLNKITCNPYEILVANEIYMFNIFYIKLSEGLLNKINVEGLSTKQINKRISKYLKSQVRDKLLQVDANKDMVYQHRLAL